MSAVRGDSYELDTESPTAPKLVRSPGAEGSDHSPTWAFTGEGGANFDCLLRRDGQKGDGWEACTSPQRYALGDDASGDYAFAVRATDRAGNTGSSVTGDYRLLAKAAGGGAASAPTPAASDPSKGAPAPAPTKDDDDTPATAGPSKPAASEKGSTAAGSKGRAGDKPAARHARGDKPAERDRGAAPARSSRPDAGAGDKPERRNALNKTLDFVGQSFERSVEAVSENADKSVFPLSLLLLVGAFLVIQGRIDRNDPKLAQAPTQADTQVPFGPPVTARRAHRPLNDLATGVE